MRTSLDDCIAKTIGRLCELMKRDGMDADRLMAFELQLGRLIGGERVENARALVAAVRRVGAVRVANRLRVGKRAIYSRRTKALAKLCT